MWGLGPSLGSEGRLNRFLGLLHLRIGLCMGILEHVRLWRRRSEREGDLLPGYCLG